MARSKVLGWSALGVCILGYGVFAALLVGANMDHLTMKQALIFGAPAIIIAEIGLWIAAGCLGWTIFKGRKAMIDRVFRKRSAKGQGPQA